MALVKCRDCGSNVSDAAPACPNCGRPQKSKPKANNNGGCLAVFILLVAGIWLYNVATGDEPTAAKSETAPAEHVETVSAEPVGFDVESHYTKNSSVSEAKCQKSLACWSDRFLVDAQMACKPEIERRARHETKWNDGFLTPTFTRFGWGGPHQDSHTQIRYIGDAVAFQNGFGAFTPMSYVCTFDTQIKAPTDVDVFEGRLDQNG